jgi:hypothetical protein
LREELLRVRHVVEARTALEARVDDIAHVVNCQPRLGVCDRAEQQQQSAGQVMGQCSRGLRAPRGARRTIRGEDYDAIFARIKHRVSLRRAQLAMERVQPDENALATATSLVKVKGEAPFAGVVAEDAATVPERAVDVAFTRHEDKHLCSRA